MVGAECPQGHETAPPALTIRSFPNPLVPALVTPALPPLVCPGKSMELGVRRELGQGQPVGEVTEVATQSSDEASSCSRQGPEAGLNVAGVKSSNGMSEPGAGRARTVAETADSFGTAAGDITALWSPDPVKLPCSCGHWSLPVSTHQRPVCAMGLTTEPTPRGCCDMLPRTARSQKCLVLKCLINGSYCCKSQ